MYSTSGSLRRAAEPGAILKKELQICGDERGGVVFECRNGKTAACEQPADELENSLNFMKKVS